MRICHYVIAALCCVLFPLDIPYASQPQDTKPSALSVNPKDDPFSLIAAQARRIEGPSARAEALIFVSLGYMGAGARNEAESLLPEILQAAGDISEPFSKAIALYEITDTYAQLGRYDKALEAAELIELPDSRAEALIKIIDHALEQGHYERAIRTAGSIEEPFSRALALYRLLEAFTGRGLYEEIVAVNHLVEEAPADVQRLMGRISRAAQRNRPDTVTKELMPVAHRSSRAQALIDMAKEYIASGEFESAQRLLEAVFSALENIQSNFGIEEYLNDYTLAKLAACYVEMRRYDLARQTIHLIRRVPHKSHPLAVLAMSYAADGNYTAALREIESIESEFSREKVYGFIARRYLEAGRHEDALSLVSAIKEDAGRRRLYAELAAYYLQAKDYAAAFALTKSVGDELIRIKILSDIVKSGYQDKAMRDSLRNHYRD